MGAGRVKEVFAQWAGKVPDRSLLILVWMAVGTKDSDPEPWFARGHEAICLAVLGREPDEYAMREVRRLIKPLVDAGALTVDRRGSGQRTTNRTAKYRIHTSGPAVDKGLSSDKGSQVKFSPRSQVKISPTTGRSNFHLPRSQPEDKHGEEENEGLGDQAQPPPVDEHVRPNLKLIDGESKVTTNAKQPPLLFEVEDPECQPATESTNKSSAHSQRQRKPHAPGAAGKLTMQSPGACPLHSRLVMLSPDPMAAGTSCPICDRNTSVAMRRLVTEQREA